MKKTLMFAATIACILIKSSAQNLVIDPGFETGLGNLPSPPAANIGWYNPSYPAVTNSGISSAYSRSGNQDAVLFQYGSFQAQLDQSLPSLVSGETTTISFWAMTTGSGALAVSLGGVYATPNGSGGLSIGTTSYTEYNYTITPTSSVPLAFVWNGSDSGNAMFMDDVSVTQIQSVPEPAMINGVMLLPFGVMALRMLRKKRP